jgi:hypothetical protein
VPLRPSPQSPALYLTCFPSSRKTPGFPSIVTSSLQPNRLCVFALKCLHIPPHKHTSHLRLTAGNPNFVQSPEPCSDPNSGAPATSPRNHLSPAQQSVSLQEPLILVRANIPRQQKKGSHAES